MDSNVPDVKAENLNYREVSFSVRLAALKSVAKTSSDVNQKVQSGIHLKSRNYAASYVW